MKEEKTIECLLNYKNCSWWFVIRIFFLIPFYFVVYDSKLILLLFSFCFISWVFFFLGVCCLCVYVFNDEMYSNKLDALPVEIPSKSLFIVIFFFFFWFSWWWQRRRHGILFAYSIWMLLMDKLFSHFLLLFFEFRLLANAAAALADAAVVDCCCVLWFKLYTFIDGP